MNSYLSHPLWGIGHPGVTAISRSIPCTHKLRLLSVKRKPQMLLSWTVAPSAWTTSKCSRS